MTQSQFTARSRVRFQHNYFRVDHVDGAVYRVLSKLERWYLAEGGTEHGEWVDLGVFTCLDGIRPEATIRCHILGCPVHTPGSSWPIVRAQERYVELEKATADG